MAPRVGRTPPPSQGYSRAATGTPASGREIQRARGAGSPGAHRGAVLAPGMAEASHSWVAVLGQIWLYGQ
jgi:hypothetical protein